MKENLFFVELLLEDILRFHSELSTSGLPIKTGIRDSGLLESAIYAPFQTFGGNDLYPSIQEKAAKILYGIVNNHAFIDGNKRIAVHAMEIFLILNQKPLQCAENEIEDIVIGVAENNISCRELVDWLNDHT